MLDGKLENLCHVMGTRDCSSLHIKCLLVTVLLMGPAMVDGIVLAPTAAVRTNALTLAVAGPVDKDSPEKDLPQGEALSQWGFKPSKRVVIKSGDKGFLIPSSLIPLPHGMRLVIELMSWQMTQLKGRAKFAWVSLSV